MFLAAAVSDFYLPEDTLTNHKIQSRELSDGLNLNLISVPKRLGTIKTEWIPNCFLISFKLETDL